MKKRKGFNHFFMNLWRYKALVLMAVPGMLWMIFFFYIPVMANVVAFKNFHISADGFLASLRESPWVGWENFKFLFSSDQAFLITKNTILYNV
ncbi:sugar ABC transporter permease, partial [Enterococcus faecium]|nr:sugar ABC transporter permease [Enterococcus faecium]MCZ1674333.1 sugar ABC transporter permease [Enterococcus faecium]MUO03300.1 sugar ABC transporter permease [Enterococcus faecium]HAP8943989.1 sugar ABC transporter permease [Enterococcus faecium]HAQ7748081.1 sugar ABC transporter permease [Enterococcus faecium]